MHLLVRRRVLWDYLTGALWILAIILVLVFLTALALLGGPGLVIYLVLWIVVPEEPLGAA
jgi:phage shock protein PspC (stress-responsive transcriptional regulator)